MTTIADGDQAGRLDCTFCGDPCECGWSGAEQLAPPAQPDPNHPASGDLLPCPFCGGTNIDPEGWMAVDADGEKSQGPTCDDCDAAAASVAMWNSRPAPPATAAGVGEADHKAIHKKETDRAAIADAAFARFEQSSTSASHDALLARVREVLVQSHKWIEGQPERSTSTYETSFAMLFAITAVVAELDAAVKP